MRSSLVTKRLIESLKRPGIIKQLEQSNRYEYGKLTVEMLREALDSIYEKFEKKQRKYVLYCGEFTQIIMSVRMYGHVNKFRIGQLERWYYLYGELIDLQEIKRHHIIVGYSKMRMKDLDLKIEKIVEKREAAYCNIKRLYYN